MTSDLARRFRIRRETKVFLAVANLNGIEKIEGLIEAGWLNEPCCHRSRKEAEKQLQRWVNTNPKGKYRDAIPAATTLYDTLFGDPSSPMAPAAPTSRPSVTQPASRLTVSELDTTYSLMATALLAASPGAAADRALEPPAFRWSEGQRELVGSPAIRKPGKVAVFQQHRQRLLTWRSTPPQHEQALRTKAQGDRFGELYGNAPRIGSANSEDALTWSAMLALERYASPGWVDRLLQVALERAGNPAPDCPIADSSTTLSLWERVRPPKSLPQREGQTEVDAMLRLDTSHLVAIEAKVHSPFSLGTTQSPDRHQWVRHVDVTSNLAKQEGRSCWPLALVPQGRTDLVDEVRAFAREPGRLAAELPHRDQDELAALAKRTGILTWEDVLEELDADTSALSDTLCSGAAKPSPPATTPTPALPERPLTELHQSALLAGRGSLPTLISTLLERDWKALYAQERATAPRRHALGKPYLVDGHDGIPSSGSHSNRREEHLAMAIFNRHGPKQSPLEVDGGHALRVLDYQVPLKARLSDAGLGKIDLLAMEQPDRLAVIELKVGGTGRSDHPVKAVAQGLAYAANLEPNLSDVRREIKEKHRIEVAEAPMIVVVMADAPYWREHGLGRGDRAAFRPVDGLVGLISRETGVSFRFVDIGEVSFEYGLDGQAPRLTGELRARRLM